MDAFLREDSEARDWLLTARLDDLTGGRARWEHK
jgi:hypothetical protein